MGILNPHTPLIWPWFLDILVEHLEAVADGSLTRLIIRNRKLRALKCLSARAQLRL